MRLTQEEKLLARQNGLSERKIRDRLRNGWDRYQAIITPLQNDEIKMPLVTAQDVRRAVVSDSTIRRRLKKGIKRSDALSKPPRTPAIPSSERGSKVYSFRTYKKIESLLDELIQESGQSASDFLGVLISQYIQKNK